MRYPTLTQLPTSRDMVDVFGGYNHNLRIRDGEFYDMQNLTGEHYPILSPRGEKRRVRGTGGSHRPHRKGQPLLCGRN